MDKHRQNEDMKSSQPEHLSPIVGENMLQKISESTTKSPQELNSRDQNLMQKPPEEIPSIHTVNGKTYPKPAQWIKKSPQGIPLKDGNQGQKPAQWITSSPPDIPPRDQNIMQKPAEWLTNSPLGIPRVGGSTEPNPPERISADSPQVLPSMDVKTWPKAVDRVTSSPQATASMDMDANMIQRPSVRFTDLPRAMPTVNGNTQQNLGEWITDSPLGKPGVDESTMQTTQWFTNSREGITETENLNKGLPSRMKEETVSGKVMEKARNYPLEYESPAKNTLEKEYKRILNNAFTAADHGQSEPTPNPTELADTYPSTSQHTEVTLL